MSNDSSAGTFGRLRVQSRQDAKHLHISAAHNRAS